MPVKWRISGALDLAVRNGNVTLAQAIYMVNVGPPSSVIGSTLIEVNRNFNRVAASPVAEVKSMIDNQWVPKAEAECLIAKRNFLADGFEASAIAYLSTVQTNQAGV